MSEREQIIEIKDVIKDYGNNSGNFNINFNILKGEVYALLGPNGAGKTTLINQLMGFIKSDSGEIKINNLNVWNDQKDIMNFLGFIPSNFLLYQNITGKKYFNLIKEFRKNIDNNYLDYLIKYFELDPNIKIKKMSKGTKQKVSLISTLMLKPEVLILDEPTAGLDPVIQEKFNNMIISLKEKGVTIFICSHIFQEVAKFCDKAAFIKNGRIVKEICIENKNIDLIEEEFLNIFKENMEFKYEKN